MIKQNFDPIDRVKPLINIGCLMDVPTGFFIKGVRGENILLGGLGAVTGIGGSGNLGKTTITKYMTLSAADKIFSTTETSIGTYDTEINTHQLRLENLISRFPNLVKNEIIKNGYWNITDKSLYLGEKWFEQLREFLETKKKNKKDLTVTTPFISNDEVNPIKILVPTFSEVDSFSEFMTSSTLKIQHDNELGESGGNMLHMRSGLEKLRFMLEAPLLAESAKHYFLLTAQQGFDSNMQTGPGTPPPVKKLQHMKPGEKFKGVTDKFYYSLNNCWETMKGTMLINQSTKSAEYPRDSFENNNPNTDLNVVSLKQLRSKSGPSGYTLEIVYSQEEGVLPTLTELHYIKDNDRFGIEGSLQNYALDLLPSMNLSRTTLRSKIDKEAALQRAINITSELAQMHHFYRYMGDDLITPKELYEGVKKAGYDWDMILNETRGWWTVNDDNHPLKFLSTKDLIEIAKGRYTPYWR